MRTILAAVSLLTRIPLHAVATPGGSATTVPAAGSVRTGAAAFPLVGALIGGLAGVICLVVGPAEPTVAACLAIGAIALVSGGLHLDGLADTVDALLAPDPARAEAARTDPAVGAGGAVALIVVIGTQIAGVSALVGTGSGGPWLAAWTLVIAAAVGRATPVVGSVVARRSLPTGAPGFGSWFRAQVGAVDVVVAMLTCAALIGLGAVATGASAVALGAVTGVLVGLGVLVGIARGRGGLDGDGFGAAIELTVAAVVVAVAVLT